MASVVKRIRNLMHYWRLSNKDNTSHVPTEYQRPPSWFCENKLDDYESPTRASFLFQSWIPQHTDKLIRSVSCPERYGFVDLGMSSALASKETRVAMLRYAESNPESYRRLVMHKLSPFRDIAKGVVVTMDWVPVTRHIVYAAASLGIPTILLPHESVFARESMYYVHPKFGINLPACDIILAWGDLQESIFVERGYPRERIIKLGAPKFDYISRIKGHGNRSAVRLLGLDPSKPVISFAAQPLDSQYDTQSARAAQSQAIVDTIAAASALGAQVIVRTPPSKDKIFGADVYSAIAANPNVALDDANLYILTPEETIEASDVVMSVNSTMLLEGALSGKVAITTKYLEFDQIWDKLRIPVVRNAGELRDVLSRGLTNPQALLDRYDTAWAAKAFSNGSFDGNAANRVREVLSEIADGRRDVHAGFALTQPFLPVISPARAAE